MSYDAEVLSDNPIFYYKCIEAEGASVMADSSENGYHGQVWTDAELGGSATGAEFQILGPIETDSPNYAGSSRYGRYPAPMPSALIPTSTFSWEVWGRSVSGTSMLLGLDGQPGLSGSNIIRISTSSGVTISCTLGGTAYSLNHSSANVSGAWYHIVVTRSGTSLLLYVNGYLAQQNTSVSAGALVADDNPISWNVGKAPNTTFYSSQGVARAAIYDTQLSATRVLAHYEAAKLTLPLRATIIVSVGVELNTDQVTPKDLGFAHNFSDTFGDSQIPIVEEIAYKTNVNQSEPDYQQRVGARPHGALRTLEYHLSPASGAARSRLHGALYTPAQRYTLPVWSDAGVTTGAANSGTNTIPVDTTKRDYQAGSYCGACTDLQDPTTYQFFKIATGGVADAQLTLETNIGTTIPSGSIVFPARLASIADDSLAVKSFAADHEDSIIRFEVLQTELSTRRITAYTPGTTYKSIEVFSLESAKVTFLDNRPYDIARRLQSHGRDYQYAVDTGSPQTFPVRFLLTTRSALSDFYGWLDARQGKLNPLWVSSRERDLTVTARPSGTTLTVSPKTGFSFHHGRRDIEFLKTDGTFSRVRVTSVTDNGSTETWAFDASVPALLDISKASFLKYCVLAQDAVELRYFKGGSNGAVIAEAIVQFRELLTSPT